MMRDYKFRVRKKGLDRKPRSQSRHLLRLAFLGLVAGSGFALFQVLSQDRAAVLDHKPSRDSEVIELPLPFEPPAGGTLPQNSQARDPSPPAATPAILGLEPDDAFFAQSAFKALLDSHRLLAWLSLPQATHPSPIVHFNKAVAHTKTNRAPAVSSPPRQSAQAQPLVLSRGPFRFEYQVQPGDTLTHILQSQGLSARLAYRILDSLSVEQRHRLTQIRAGERLSILLDEALELDRLELRIDATRRLLVTRQGDEIRAQVAADPTEQRRLCLTAVVDHSLYGAAHSAGIPDPVIQNAISLFRDQIDFAKQTRRGDRLSVLFEQTYTAADHPVDTGPLLAVEITNGNKHYTAVRYTTAAGKTRYYSADGEPLAKASTSFLRTPVNYTRISSHFSTSRVHPILRRARPHTGVDLAAPAGRRVLAAADGRVDFRGTKGGYGKLVILQHSARYETRYAHLMRYATGLTTGDQVKRGQVIGYVGQTGLATGPHLHYEIRINGKPVNPMTAKLPFLDALDDREKARFRRHTRVLLAELEHPQDRNLLVDTRWDAKTTPSAAE
jgi:murein DD-endopeptidase MepM/ murein hydrolase activator NlpD